VLNCLERSEFRHFILALWFGDAAAAAKDLIEPAWKLVPFPEEVVTAEMAAMHATCAETCHLRALDRYLARLVDGLDWSGNCRYVGILGSQCTRTAVLSLCEVY
jgi:hypothetical protein